MKRLFLPLSAAMLLAPLAVFAKPSIGTVFPNTATANIPVTLSANVTSAVPIQSCKIYIDLEEFGPMNVSGGVASIPFTFQFGGSHIAFVFCRDTQNGIAAGDNTAITVSGNLQNSQPFGDATPNPNPTATTQDRPTVTPPAQTTTPTPTQTTTPTPAPATNPSTETPRQQQNTQDQTRTETPPPTAYTRHLLKIACPANVNADNPCKAVYYIGIDGKRHAFPNSRIFLTWYGGFDSVQEVSTTVLSQFELGPNVQYRAGVRMVKFTTDNKVYVVSRGGILRWVKSEELARAFYGNDWNKKIDDVPDTFYTNYSFGADIESTNQYNPEAERNNAAE